MRCNSMKHALIILFVSFSCLSFNTCDDVPVINQEIVKLAKKKMRKKVGRGECWDLAKYVLDATDAKWNGYDEYGKRYNYKKQCVFPGDIIQFERVKIRYKIGNTTYYESMKHHTAIVYEVISDNEITILHQNTGEHGRKVGKSTLRFDTVRSGKMMFYRPVSS